MSAGIWPRVDSGELYKPISAECHKRRLNQGSFVLLCFALFAFSELCLVSVNVSVCDLSSVLYFPA